MGWQLNLLLVVCEDIGMRLRVAHTSFRLAYPDFMASGLQLIKAAIFGTSYDTLVILRV